MEWVCLVTKYYGVPCSGFVPLSSLRAKTEACIQPAMYGVVITCLERNRWETNLSHYRWNSHLVEADSYLQQSRSLHLEVDLEKTTICLCQLGICIISMARGLSSCLWSYYFVSRQCNKGPSTIACNGGTLAGWVREWRHPSLYIHFSLLFICM